MSVERAQQRYEHLYCGQTTGEFTRRLQTALQHELRAQQRRRYVRSLANLPRALALSDHALIFDNSSTDGYQLLLEWADGHAISRAPTLPRWLQDHLGDVLGQMPESS